MADNPSPDNKKPSTEDQPLLSQAGSSTNAPPAERPRTVRHHRRTLSGRSVRSGHFQFGPSYHPNIYPAVNNPFTRQAKRAADARARSRFFKALLLGVGLWLVIGLVLGWTGWQEFAWGDGKNRPDYGAKPRVPSSEGDIVSCAEFASASEVFGMPGDKERSTASFSLPVKEGDSVFIHGHGSFAKGRISLDVSSSDQVEVDVIASYNDEALIHLMNVCHVTKHEPSVNQRDTANQVGLVIYTPSPEVGPYPDSDLEFRVNVRLPRSLKSLYTMQIRGDMFVIKAEDLSSISIARLDFETTLGSISLSKILSHAARIRTQNGRIDGFFSISKTLSLATKNGAINAQVALIPPSDIDSTLPDLPPNPPSKGTSAQIILPFSPNTNISTSVHATTTNGAVAIKYVKHPVDQKLFSFVSSTNGKVEVEHAPAFEGEFEAETTWGSAVVKGPLSHHDPKGEDRERKKITRTDRDELGYRHILGSIWWSDSQTEDHQVDKGDTVVKTTLGSAEIVFN